MVKYLPKKILFSSLLVGFYLFAVFVFGKPSQLSWEKLTQGSHAHTPPFLSVTFLDSANGFAITPVDIKKTEDGGKTWATQFTSEDARKSFYLLNFIDSARGFIVGSQRVSDIYTPIILNTKDGGKSWREISVNAPQQLDFKAPRRLHSISFCDDKTGWLAGSDLILHTTDGGQTWETERSNNPEETIFSVQCISPEKAWAVGQKGLLLSTTDGGKNWNTQDSGTKDNLVRVRFYNGNGWAVGGHEGSGTILRTQDNGVTWEKLSPNTQQFLFDIYLSGQQGWVVGANGTILYTENAGQSWLPQEKLTSNDLITLFFLSSQDGWIAGDKMTVLHLSTK
jgi:photosystem II stability/assembly factor-like uncharacterized protein